MVKVVKWVFDTSSDDFVEKGSNFVDYFFHLILLRQIIMRICKICFVVLILVMHSNLVYPDTIPLRKWRGQPRNAFYLRVEDVF